MDSDKSKLEKLGYKRQRKRNKKYEQRAGAKESKG